MRTVIPRKYSFHRGGFTLTELLVAIALLMIIMVSVATIFRSSGQAVSVGMAITEQNRAMAAFSQQFQQDVVGYTDADPLGAGYGMFPVNVPPGIGAPPFLFIRSVSQLGWPDKATQLAAGPQPSFRLDSLGFFAKGAFKRQTGSPVDPNNAEGNFDSPPVLVDEMANFNDAYIWYGHLRLPDNAGGWADPGAGASATNPNNYYANQWVLGRRAMLLGGVMQIGSPGGIDGHIYAYGHAAWFNGRWWDAGQLNGSGAAVAGSQWDHQNFAPLGYDVKDGVLFSPAYLSRTGSFPMVVDNGTWAAKTLDTTQEIVNSRYDLVGMNREQNWADYANIVQAYQGDHEAGLLPDYAMPWVRRYFSQRHYCSLLDTLDIDWAGGASVPANQRTFAETAAKAVPALLRSCTNFTVEFAGDYVSQDSTGAITGTPYAPLSMSDPTTWHMDGVIDFDRVPVPNTSPMQYTRKVHWYGLPRVVTPAYTDAVGNTIPADAVTSVTEMRLGLGSPLPVVSPVPFESYYADASGTYFEWGWSKEMLRPTVTVAPGLPLSFAPRLIRVTVQVNDPQGRVMDDMTRTYIFPVKRN